MRKAFHVLVLLLVIVWWAFPAAATPTFELTFDDLPTPNDKGLWGVVPEDYQDFSWKYVEVVNADAYAKIFNNKKITFPSAPNAAYNGGPEGGYEVVAMASNQHFILEGAYFSSWAQNNKLVSYGSTGLTVTGYLDGEIVGSSSFSLTPTFVWQDLKLGPVDLVEFRHLEKDNAHWWLMDNLQATVVPLPGTILLLCVGLAGLFIFGRRRRYQGS